MLVSEIPLQKSFMRLFSLLIAGLMIFCDMAFAVMSFPQKRITDSVAQSAVSPFHARLKDVYMSPGNEESRFLFVIEDAHTNPSAQLNIRNSIEDLKSGYNLRHIFMEASTGDVSLDFLNESAAESRRKKIGEAFVKKGLLQGSELSSLTDDEIVLWGVENPELYEASVQLYRNKILTSESYELYFSKVLRLASFVAEQDLHPELFRMVDLKYRFQKGEVAFSAYLNALIRSAGRSGVQISSFPVISEIIRIKEMERSINFDAARSEQQEVYNQILVSGSEELKELIRNDQSRRYAGLRQEGTLSVEDSVLEFIHHSGSDAQYKEYIRYLNYRIKSSGLEFEAAVSELEKFEHKVMTSMASDKEQLDTLQLLQSVADLYDVGRLKATSEQFASVKKSPGLIPVLALLNRRIEMLNKGFEYVLEYSPQAEQQISDSVRFYELTFDRDRHMVRNTLLKMRDDGISEAALIVGGFHTENIRRILKSLGISHAVIAPVVLHETDESRYETLLTLKKPDLSVINLRSEQQLNIGIRGLANSLRPLENPDRNEELMIFRLADALADNSGARSVLRQKIGDELERRKQQVLSTAASRLSVNPDRAIARVLIDEQGIPTGYQVFENPEKRDQASIHSKYIDFYGPSGMRKAAELLSLLRDEPDYEELVEALGPYEREKQYMRLLQEFRAEHAEFLEKSSIYPLSINAENESFLAYLIKEDEPVAEGQPRRQLIYVVNLNRSAGPDRKTAKENANIRPVQLNPELEINVEQNVRLRDVKPSYSSLKQNEVSYFRRGQSVFHNGIHIALAPFFEDGKRSSQMIFLEEEEAERLNFYIQRDKTRKTGRKRLKGSASSVAWERPLTVQAGQTVVVEGTLHLSFPQNHPQAIQSMKPEEVERVVTAAVITDVNGFRERIPVKLLPGQLPGSEFDYQVEITVSDPGLFQVELEFSIPGDDEKIDAMSVTRDGTKDPDVAALKDVTFLGLNESQTKGSIVALATEDDRLLKPKQRKRIARSIVDRILSDQEKSSDLALVQQMITVVYDMLGSVMKEGGVMASPDLQFDFENWETAIRGNPAYGYVWIRDAASFGSALIDLYNETRDPAIASTIEHFREYLYKATKATGKIDAQRFSISGKTVPPTSWGHQSDGPGHIAQFLLKYLKTFHGSDKSQEESAVTQPLIGKEEAIDLLKTSAGYIVDYTEKAYYYTQHRDFIGGSAAEENDPRAHDYWEVMYGMNFSTDVHFYSVLKEIERAVDPQTGYIQDAELANEISRILTHADGLRAIDAIKVVAEIYEKDGNEEPSRYLRSQKHVGNVEDFLEQKPEAIDAVVIAALTMVQNPLYQLDSEIVLGTYNVIDDAYQQNHHVINHGTGAYLDYTLRESPFWSALREKYPHATVWWRHPGDSYNGLYLNAGFGKPTGKGNPWHISIDWPVVFNMQLLNKWIDEGGITVRDQNQLKELNLFLARHGVDVTALNLKPGKLSSSDERFKTIVSSVYRTVDQTLLLQQELIPEGESAAEQIDAETGEPRGATALTWSNWQYTVARLEKSKLNEKIQSAGLFTALAARLADNSDTQTTVSLPKRVLDQADEKLVERILEAEQNPETDSAAEFSDEERLRLSELIAESFDLSDDIVRRIADRANSEIEAAVAGAESSVLMKESDIDLNRLSTAKGLGLGIDFGGTKVHLKLTRIDAAASLVETLAEDDIEIPVDEILKKGGNEIFGFIADAVDRFIKNNSRITNGKKVASVFVFSYPKGKNGEIVAPTESNRGSSIKNANFEGTYGQKPREFLNRLLSERNTPVDIRLDPNDTETVAAYGYVLRRNTLSGIVGGGGFNIAVRIGGKLYNSELGNLNLGPELESSVLNQNDPIIYTRGLENLVSGIFLGERTRIELKHLIDLGLLFKGRSSKSFDFKASDEDPEYGLNSRYVSMIASDTSENLEATDKALQKLGITDSSLTDRRIVKNITDKIFERSYRAVAAAQLGIYEFLQNHSADAQTLSGSSGDSFTADGSVIGSEGYLDGVQSVLDRFLPTGILTGYHESGSSTVGGIIAAVAADGSEGARLASNLSPTGKFAHRIVLNNPGIQHQASSVTGVDIPLNTQQRTSLLRIRQSGSELEYRLIPYISDVSARLSSDIEGVSRVQVSSGWKKTATELQKDETPDSDVAFDQLELSGFVESKTQQVDDFLLKSGYQLKTATHYQIPVNMFRIEDDRVFRKQIEWMVQNMERANRKWGSETVFELTHLKELENYHYQAALDRFGDPQKARRFQQSRSRIIDRAVSRHSQFILVNPSVDPVNPVRLYVPELDQKRQDGPVNISVQIITDHGAADFYGLFGAGKSIVLDLTHGGVRQGFEESVAEDITQQTFDFVNSRTSVPFENKPALYRFTVERGVNISFDILRRHTWKFLRIIPIGSEIQSFQTMIYTLGISA